MLPQTCTPAHSAHRSGLCPPAIARRPVENTLGQKTATTPSVPKKESIVARPPSHSVLAARFAIPKATQRPPSLPTRAAPTGWRAAPRDAQAIRATTTRAAGGPDGFSRPQLVRTSGGFCAPAPCTVGPAQVRRENRSPARPPARRAIYIGPRRNRVPGLRRRVHPAPTMMRRRAGARMI